MQNGIIVTILILQVSCESIEGPLDQPTIDYDLEALNLDILQEVHPSTNYDKFSIDAKPT